MYQNIFDTNSSINVFSNLPDQFTRFEKNTYNPFDFYTSSADYNLFLINNTYREEQLKRIQFYRQKELDNIKKKSSVTKPKQLPLTQLSLNQHLINFKASIFGVLHDWTNDGITLGALFKNNRAFYLGISLVMLFVLFLIFEHLIKIN